LTILNTLIELQRLKRLDRTGWTLRGLPNGTESVASHSFGVGIAAMLLADRFRSHGVDLDSEKVLRLALLHDWAEVRVGDMPRTATHYYGAEVRKQAENAAFNEIISNVGETREIYKQLHAEYELRESLEARLVKAADIIDLLVQVLALERAGARGLDEFWEAATTTAFHLDGVELEIVQELIDELLRARTELK